MNQFLKYTIPAVLGLAAVLCLVSCGKAQAADRVQGTWYEQAENGDVLTISGDKIHLKSGWTDYEADSRFTVVRADQLEEAEAWSPEREAGNLGLKQDNYYVFFEIYYLPDEDSLVCYDMPHTDGDGGHHRHLFLRTPYVAPPEPTYGERTDASDKNAPKSLPAGWMQKFRKMEMSFFDAGVQQYPDMAIQYPAEGIYQYTITAEGGNAVLTSDFCPEPVALSAETLLAVLSAVEQHDIPSLNGLDIRTADVPENLSGYTFALELESGEVIRSAANHKDVPENWKAFQEEVHTLLFETMEKAGYNPYTKEFHSTLPMKRFGAGDAPAYSVGIRQEAIEKEWHKKGVTFKVWYDLMVPGDDCPAPLKAAVEQFNQDTERRANEAEAVFGQEYNFVAYDVQPSLMDSMLFTFRVVETHMRPDYSNDLEVRYYCFDAKTGKRLYITDLIPDADALQERFTDAFVKAHSWIEDLIRGDNAQKTFRTLIREPGTEGPLYFSISDGAVLIYPPRSVLEGRAWVERVAVWYEDIQDLMNDQYVTVRAGAED